MALSVYSMTPFWLAGVLFLIPSLIGYWLAFLVSLYGYYILYLGFAAPMMETPKDKQLSYFIITAVVILVGISLIYVIASAIFPLYIYPPGLPTVIFR